MTYHYFKPHTGGIEETMYELSKKLLEKGHKITVITSNIGQMEIRPEREIIEGIDVIRCEAKHWIFRAIKLKKFKEKLKEVKPDIFHTHHPIPGVSDTTIFFAKKNKIPSVLTYHADSSEDTIFNKIAARIYYKLIANKMVETADVVVTQTKSYAETSPVLKNFLEKIIIIPTGIDTKKFNPKIDGKKIRERYDIEDKFVIFALGRMVPYKGFSYLIEAMKYMDKNYVLILGGDGILKDRLVNLAKRLKVYDKVIFTGFVPESEKITYYAACDVFCLSSISRGEAFGKTLLEAMACGKPVVATNIPGVRDVASIGGELVEPRNPTALAEALKRAVENPINKYKLYQRVKSRFSWENISKQYIKIYKKLSG